MILGTDMVPPECVEVDPCVGVSQEACAGFEF
jgi:hypothetical protein